MSGPLRCLVVDLDQKPVRLVSVAVFLGINVLKVKEMVLAKALFEIGLNEPAVWRCCGLKVQGNKEDKQAFEARVRTFDLSNNQHAEQLPDEEYVLKLKVPPDEMLLVQLPSMYSLSILLYASDLPS